MNIDYSEYTTYDNLEKLDVSFIGNPSKDLETDIYNVYFESPITIQLPKSKLEEIVENEYEKYIAKYIIKDKMLLEFFDNMDALIINLSNKYSMKWFGKNLDQKILIQFYENLYNIENDQKYLEFLVDDDDLLEELTEYNIDDDLDISVSLVSIEIYKQQYRVLLKLDSLDYENDEIVDDELNFEHLINSQKKICGTEIINENTFNYRDDRQTYSTNDEATRVQETDTAALEKNQDFDQKKTTGIYTSAEDSDDDSHTDNEENDTQEEETENTVDEDIDENYSLEDYETDVNKIISAEKVLLKKDEKLRNEVLQIIKNKENQREKFATNSIRVEEANNTLKDQVSNLDEEIKSFKEQLKKL